MKVTIQKIIDTVRTAMDATDFTEAQIVGWIAEAEAAVVDEIISRYEDFNENINTDYDENTDRGTLLLAPKPYSRIYEYYVKAQINYARDELERYQNDLAQYKGAMDDFWVYYNQRHKPQSVRFEV